jgi:hypothetical protein
MGLRGQNKVTTRDPENLKLFTNTGDFINNFGSRIIALLVFDDT